MNTLAMKNEPVEPTSHVRNDIFSYYGTVSKPGMTKAGSFTFHLYDLYLNLLFRGCNKISGTVTRSWCAYSDASRHSIPIHSAT